MAKTTRSSSAAKLQKGKAVVRAAAKSSVAKGKPAKSAAAGKAPAAMAKLVKAPLVKAKPAVKRAAGKPVAKLPANKAKPLPSSKKPAQGVTARQPAQAVKPSKPAARKALPKPAMAKQVVAKRPVSKPAASSKAASGKPPVKKVESKQVASKPVASKPVASKPAPPKQLPGKKAAVTASVSKPAGSHTKPAIATLAVRGAPAKLPASQPVVKKAVASAPAVKTAAKKLPAIAAAIKAPAAAPPSTLYKGKVASATAMVSPSKPDKSPHHEPSHKNQKNLSSPMNKLATKKLDNGVTREDGRYALPASTLISLPPGYRPASHEEYMNPQHLAYFRNKLRDWREQLVEESRQTMDNLRDEVRDVGDEAERATRETENSLELRTRDRYRKLISKIDKALRRIEDGSYGFCEETDEEIGVDRLDARPIATLSLDAQERREHLQKQMGD
jgi:DnaK suppressor protein